MNNEREELYEKTIRIRGEFLDAEIALCATGLEMAEYELSVGGLETVAREVSLTEQGIRTIRRFLGGVTKQHQRRIQERISNLEARLKSLKAQMSGRSV